MLGFLRRMFGVGPTEGRSPKWPAFRAAWIRAHPTCAACGGRDHLQVHHKWPFSWPGGDRPEKELGLDNVMTLCESPGRDCHLWVGHSGDFKARNPDAEQDAAALLRKIVNRPYPPKGT